MSSDAHDPAVQAAHAEAATPEQQALLQALASLLAPAARLSVARGLPFAEAEELLKRAFVAAAAAAHPQLPAHRRVSRISTATGLNRREVGRLMAPGPAGTAAPVRSRSLAAEVSARWRTRALYRDGVGAPAVLPRQGPAPSFESLAQEVTRDVHPRSVLDELCRLGLATWDEAADRVRLVGDAFVPSGDRVRMLGLLGRNVGDHLDAAVANVLGEADPPHLEQALAADGLSEESLAALRPLVRQQWQALRAALVPAMQAAIDADAKRGAPSRARVRIGLFEFHASPPQPAATPEAAPVEAPRRRRRRE